MRLILKDNNSKMKRKNLKLTVGMFLLVGAMSVKAQTDSINVVTTAVPFLRISPDARAGGMGDLGVATSQMRVLRSGISQKYHLPQRISA
jgi:hypothetical protein